ncbi:MAG: hypothetical protein EOP77_00280 [Variovorax sp.]|nr:MAG: hypothetical protein EOP77_00280 [Variovorax sp.]
MAKITDQRRKFTAQCLGWCLAGVLLAALNPFLFTRFRQDGWEDEPGYRVRNSGAMAQFIADERLDPKSDLETTLYVSTAARLEITSALKDGLAGLMALVALLLPFAVAVMRPFSECESSTPEPVHFTSGAPPPPAAEPWRTLPPQTAPPFSV